MAAPFACLLLLTPSSAEQSRGPGKETRASATSLHLSRNTSSFRTVSRQSNNAAWKAHVELQQSKWRSSEAMRLKIRGIDVGRQHQVARQFATFHGGGAFRGETVICLGARLGGEVRAFKGLGALAVGVDLEPGEDNMDVLVGDFENLAFPEASFGFAYCNVLDHINNLAAFAHEVCRVVKPEGFFFAVLYTQAQDVYNGQQAITADAYAILLKEMSPAFSLVRTEDLIDVMRIREHAREIDPASPHLASVMFRPWRQAIKTLTFKKRGPCAEQAHPR